MPGGDGTGPGGMGPMTGRAAGYCAGYAVPGHMSPVGGQGYFGGGRGRGGGGWGRRNRFYASGLTGWQRAAMGASAYCAPPAYPVPYAAQPGPTQTAQQELDMLKGQAEYFEDTLEGIRKQIDALQAKAAEKAK